MKTERLQHQWLFVALAVVAGACTASVASAGAASSPGTPQIQHLPVTFGAQGQAIAIDAEVESPGNALIYLRLYFKPSGDNSFRYVELRRAAATYTGEIPAIHVKPPTVQYFMIALFSDHQVVSLPATNPYGNPFEVLIQEQREKERQPVSNTKSGTIKTQPESGESSGKQGTETAVPSEAVPSEAEPAESEPKRISPQLLEKLRQLEPPRAEGEEEIEPGESTLAAEPDDEQPILILSPEPLSTVPANEALIAASFSPSAGIDSTSVKVLIDGKNVTKKAEISSVLVSLDPGPLPPGRHSVTIVANFSSQTEMAPVTWSFEAANNGEGAAEAFAQKKSTATGIVYADLNHEKFNTRTLDNNSIGGNLNGQYGPASYQAQLYLTSLEDEGSQPRHRMTISAGVPWLSFTLGDATPYLNDLVLWGRRVRGLQARLYTGILNVDFITGETMRKVSPVPNGRPATFRQSLMGIRPSFGSKSFQFGLVLLKAKDDTSSVPSGSASYNPRGNLVVGTDLLMSFHKGRTEFKASAAHSFVTNDLTLPVLSKAFVDSAYGVELPFDPANFEDWLAINESTTPLDPRGLTGLAYQFGVRLNYFNHYFSAGFKQIGAEFISLGHSFLRNDIRGYYLNDRFRLFRNRVFVTLGYEHYDDHFSNASGDPETALKTLQLGFSLNWSPELPSLSFNLRNHNRDNGIDTLTTAGTITGSQSTIDTREDNSARNFNFVLSQQLQFLDRDHTLSLSTTTSNRVDRWAPVGGEANSTLRSLTLKTKHNIPLITTLSFAANNNKVSGQQGPFKYSTFSAQAEYRFPRPEWRAFGTLRITGASGISGAANSAIVSVIDYTQTGLQLGGAMNRGRHEFMLEFALLRFSDQGGVRTINSTTSFVQNQSYTNTVFRTHYEFRF